MDLKSFINEAVSSTREYVFVREDDCILIIKPNKLHYLNNTATKLLSRMYSKQEKQSYDAVIEIAQEYGMSEEAVANDAKRLIETILELLKNPDELPLQIKPTPFGTHKRELPIISEIALTYNCQNKCLFCYASSPERGDKVKSMTFDQVKKVLYTIRNKAKAPTVSFTGGEPTLREDLTDLVAYAKSIGLRVNLITNGIVCGTTDLAQKLKIAGLDSAQVSLESSIPDVHDKIVQNPGSFYKTVEGFRRLKQSNIHTHINSTICSENIKSISLLPKFAKEELGLSYQSMNMVIRTGHAQDHPNEIGYTEIAKVLPEIQKACKENKIKLVWYSPMPYCIINTVAFGIGGTTCAACDGLLSVAPDGSLLPCSSFQDGVGNLLNESFDNLWWNRQSLYFRRKEFLPPVCTKCDKKSVCNGACPLYWENKGSFNELKMGKDLIGNAVWKAKRRVLGKSHPVGGVK